MKILRDVEWTPVYFVNDFYGLGKTYIFRNEKYGDYIAVKEAKWILTTENKSLWFNANLNRVVHVATNEEIDITDYVNLVEL